jgi:transposase
VRFPRATRFPLYRQSEIYAREGLELDRCICSTRQNDRFPM